VSPPRRNAAVSPRRRTPVSSAGEDSFEDTRIAYAIVEALTHEQAVKMFAGHPHLGLRPGNSIDVLECPAPPA
jgi:hypothetical protein